jgi:hypothetical protein
VTILVTVVVGREGTVGELFSELTLLLFEVLEIILEGVLSLLLVS